MAGPEAPHISRETIKRVAIISCLLLAIYQSVEFEKSSFLGENLTLSTITSRDGSNNVQIPNGAFCLFIKSSPKSTQTRQCIRETCEYQDHFFLVGQPAYADRRVKEHRQGLLASNEEVEVAGSIIAESDEFRDILAVPYRDYGLDDSAKYLESLRYGVKQNCSYTIIGDDGMCLKLSRIKEMVTRHYQQQNDGIREEIYFEYNLISNDNNTTQSVAGSFSVVSHRLASIIVHQDWTHSALSPVLYSRGNYSQGPIMTKWVDYVKTAHNVSVHHLIQNAPLQNTETVCDETYERKPVNYTHDLCIVTLSGASMFDSRQCQRETCRPGYGNVPHVFAVGIPSDAKTDAPSIESTANEVNISNRILAEQEIHGDLLVTLNNDYYMDLPEKRMAVLNYGVEHKCAYTIKVDDEYCVNIPLVQKLIAKHEQEHPKQELYFGNLLWKGTEYKIMQGTHGDYVSYMSGHCNGASYRLSSYIVNQRDWTHTVMRANYGSSSEDVDMGFWVDYAMKRYNLKVEYVANRNIKKDIPQGACDNVNTVSV